jgi:hypothetical protein
LRGACSITFTNKHGNCIQCIEKEMRIELCLQRREARTGELLGEARHLNLTLTHFCKIPRGMFDPNHGQVDSHAKRKCDKEPACEGPPGITLQRLWLQKRPQHGSGARPNRTEKKRDEQMQRSATNQMGTCQRPASRDREHSWRKQSIQETVAGDKEDCAQRCWFISPKAGLHRSVDAAEDRGNDPCCGNEQPRAHVSQGLQESHQATLSRAHMGPQPCERIRPFASTEMPLAYLALPALPDIA